MRIGEKPQECSERFFDFFSRPHGLQWSRCKSGVENRRPGHTEKHQADCQGVMGVEALLLDIAYFHCVFGRLWKQFDGCHGFVSKAA
jgi:hypothetical protein